MANSKQAQNQDAPKPDPALKQLNRFVGTWNLKGHPIGSDEDSITGTTTFKWLTDDGQSFFLEQDMDMDFDGKPIKSHELIGYNPKTKAFASYVYSNMPPDPWPYAWEVQDDDLIISIKKPPMDATFHAKFSPDGKSFSGGWRPNPGADVNVNSAYDITATRVG